MRFDSDIHMTMACIWPRGQCGNGPVTYMSRNRSYRFSFLLMFSISFVLGLLVILLSASYLFPYLQSLRVTSAVTLSYYTIIRMSSFLNTVLSIALLDILESSSAPYIKKKGKNKKTSLV